MRMDLNAGVSTGGAAAGACGRILEEPGAVDLAGLGKRLRQSGEVTPCFLGGGEVASNLLAKGRIWLLLTFCLRVETSPLLA